MGAMKKTVLLTGCSSGIGAATARLFASRDWNVIATMRTPSTEPDWSRLEQVIVRRLDVTDPASIESAIGEGLARFGKIDALINNAGFGLTGVFESFSREKIQEQFDVNLFGVMDVTRALLPHFRENNAGTIINVSSRAGLVSFPMLSLYCASKAALEAFSESLAYELAAQNIVVKIVEPGGGVTGTRFPQTTGAQAAEPPVDYDEFVARTKKIFATMAAKVATSSEDVAGAIYQAATDGTNRLRYFVGEDTGGLIRARQQKSEEEYLEFMRAHFRGKS